MASISRSGITNARIINLRVKTSFFSIILVHLQDDSKRYLQPVQVHLLLAEILFEAGAGFVRKQISRLRKQESRVNFPQVVQLNQQQRARDVL